MNHEYSVRLNKSERLFERAFTFALRRQIKPYIEFYMENGYIGQSRDLIKPEGLKLPYTGMFVDEGMIVSRTEYNFQEKQTRDRSKSVGWDVLRMMMRRVLSTYATAHYLTISNSITSTTIKIVDRIEKRVRDNGGSDADIIWQINKYESEGTKSRARNIAVTESGYIANASRFLAALNYFQQQGLSGYKKYITREDERVRPSHANLHGRVLPMEKDFHFQSGATVEFAPYPCSDVLSIGEKANCRCTCIYFSEDLLDEYQ